MDCKMRFKPIFFLILFLVFSSGVVNSQSNEIKIKNDFLQTISQELRSLQKWGISSKDNPESTIQYWKFNNTWFAFYSDWDNEYSCDIKKTDSIITPYIGIVTFY